METLVFAIKLWVERLVKNLTADPEDAIRFSAETGIVEPVAVDDNTLYTTSDGEIYVF